MKQDDAGKRVPSTESEGLLRAVVETAVDGILTIDERGTVRTMNAAAERIFGYAAAEVIGRNVNVLMPEPYRTEHDRYLANYFATNVPRIIGIGREVEGRRKDGTVFPLELSVSETWVGEARIFTGIVRDITARKAAEEALRISEGLLRAVVDTAVDGILTIDERGAVRTMNPAAERIFGYRSDEVVGQNVRILMPEPYRTEHDGYLDSYLRTGERKIIGVGREVVGLRKDGSVFPMELAVSETQLEDRRIFTGIVRDITARKRAEMDLERQANALARQAVELARSNSELERFAYVASHDLQEPMRTVSAYAQLLGRRYRGKLDREADEFITFMTTGVARMQTLLDDLLAYSRVESRGAALAVVDGEAVITRVLDDLRLAIGESGAVITRDKMPRVLADATQLAQVLLNILSNALKFRGKRQPRIHIGVTEQGDEWRFFIRDNGIGIDPEYHEQVFVIFQRLHTIEEYGGTGIGLAICKRIIERHGGSIGVESRLGEGSTFWFTIPKRQRHR